MSGACLLTPLTVFFAYSNDVPLCFVKTPPCTRWRYGGIGAFPPTPLTVFHSFLKWESLRQSPCDCHLPLAREAQPLVPVGVRHYRCFPFLIRTRSPILFYIIHYTTLLWWLSMASSARLCIRCTQRRL